MLLKACAGHKIESASKSEFRLNGYLALDINFAYR